MTANQWNHVAFARPCGIGQKDASRRRNNKTTTIWLNGVVVFSGTEATVIPLNLGRDVIVCDDVPATPMAQGTI